MAGVAGVVPPALTQVSSKYLICVVFADHESSCHKIVANASDWLTRCELITISARPSLPI